MVERPWAPFPGYYNILALSQILVIYYTAGKFGGELNVAVWLFKPIIQHQIKILQYFLITCCMRTIYRTLPPI